MGSTAIDHRTLVISDPAQADLDDIYDHIAADSPVQAERFIHAIVTDLHRIAGIGHIGASREWIKPGLRSHVYGKYCAYLRADPDSLTVIRVLNGSREVDAITFDQPKY